MPRLAVIGFPVGHSRSPAMQNAALAALGLADEWSYEAIEVAPEGFERRLLGMHDEGFAGANVTIPHKEAALALAEGRTEAASRIGAANTLSFGPEGWIEADNTDAGGLLGALPPFSARRALVLGAGGAARAAVWALGHGAMALDGGAVTGRTNASLDVDVWNRTGARAEEVAAEFGVVPTDSPVQSAYGLIVNTTAVGLGAEDPFDHLPLAAQLFTPEQVVVDMVYGDEPTALLVAAAATGATVVDGLEILVQQGALSLKIWTGREPDLEVMRAAARG